MKISYSVRNLPKDERPRERLSKFGPEALSAQELIAIVLGRGVAGETVLVTAQKLLSYFGSLDSLCSASLEDLQTIKGIGFAKACQIKAISELSLRLKKEDVILFKQKSVFSPQEMYAVVYPKIGKYKKEHFVLVSLDTRNKVIGVDTISVGTLNASLVHPREMFEIAILRHAASVIIAHNHPSGDSEPSNEDIAVTEKLVKAGKLLGIPVLDHLITGKNTFYSFCDANMLE